MFLGPLRPLPPDVRLCALLVDVCQGGTLGAWVSRCSPGQRVYRAYDLSVSLLLNADLGFLLSRCARVVVREGERPVSLDADTIIQWRALQVATATPWLPGCERLVALFPGIERRAGGMLIPLRQRSPEEILAQCLASGLEITGSKVTYARPTSRSSLPMDPRCRAAPRSSG